METGFIWEDLSEGDVEEGIFARGQRGGGEEGLWVRLGIGEVAEE